MGGSTRCNGFKAQITPNTVFKVDNKVAFRNLGRFAQEVVGLAAPSARAAHAIAKDILLGYKPQTLAPEASFNIKDDHSDMFMRQVIGNVFPALAWDDLAHPMFAQQRDNPVARAIGICRNDNLVLLAALGRDEITKLVIQIDVRTCTDIPKITACARPKVINAAFRIFIVIVRRKFQNRAV